MTTLMLLSSLLLPQTAATPAIDVLKQVRDHYQSLSSFSMRVEHQDSSGLFPGKYSQTLRWRKGGRFELIVTSKGNAKVPDYFANGDEVLFIRPDGERITDSVVPAAGISPGWEVSGGMILSWLQNTETGKLFFHPPKGLDVDWSFGPRTEWNGSKVREVVCSGSQGQGPKRSFSLFVDPSKKILIGMEAMNNGKRASAVYTAQKENETLPPVLGNAPKR